MFADEEQTRQAQVLHFPFGAYCWSLIQILCCFLPPASILAAMAGHPHLQLHAASLATPESSRSHAIGENPAHVELWVMATVLAFTAQRYSRAGCFDVLRVCAHRRLLFGGKGGVIVSIVFCLTALGIAAAGQRRAFFPQTDNHTALSIWVRWRCASNSSPFFSFWPTASIKAALKQKKQTETLLA